MGPLSTSSVMDASDHHSAVSSAITFDIYAEPAASSAPLTTDNGPWMTTLRAESVRQLNTERLFRPSRPDQTIARTVNPTDNSIRVDLPT